MNNNISGLTVNFDSPIQIRPGLSTDKIIITKVIDDLDKKRAIAICYNYKVTVLWEGNQYDSAGQWTDTDVINRLKQIVLNS